MSWKECDAPYARVEAHRLAVSKGLLEVLGKVRRVRIYADREMGRLALVQDPAGKPIGVYKRYASMAATRAIRDLGLSLGDRLVYVETTKIDGKTAFVLEVEDA